MTSAPVRVMAGGVRSTTSERVTLAELVLPALSVAVAVIVCSPSLNVPDTKANVPPASAVAWPSAVPSS